MLLAKGKEDVKPNYALRDKLRERGSQEHSNNSLEKISNTLGMLLLDERDLVHGQAFDKYTSEGTLHGKEVRQLCLSFIGPMLQPKAVIMCQFIG